MGEMGESTELIHFHWLKSVIIDVTNSGLFANEGQNRVFFAFIIYYCWEIKN